MLQHIRAGACLPCDAALFLIKSAAISGFGSLLMMDDAQQYHPDLATQQLKYTCSVLEMNCSQTITQHKSILEITA